MAVKLTNRKQIVARLQETGVNAERAIYLGMRRVGLDFVNNARSMADFKDQTGNLRASIGFLIAKDGKILDQDFTGKPEGRSNGVSYAKSLEKGEGYVLIVVAGMNYAAAVESRGKDVLTNSAAIATELLRSTFSNLKSKTTLQ